MLAPEPLKSIEIDENDTNLFEDYDDESDDDDYTELDFLLSEYVSRTIDVLSDDTKSACDTILMAQGLPSYYPPVASSSANTEATPGVQFLRES